MRAAVCREFGSPLAIEDVELAADDAPRRVRELTDGLGADSVLVAAGATAAVEPARRCGRC